MVGADPVSPLRLTSPCRRAEIWTQTFEPLELPTVQVSKETSTERAKSTLDLYRFCTYFYVCLAISSTLSFVILEQQLETERFKRNPVANKVLAHGLNPMQTQAMQHSTCTFHHAKNRQSQEEPNVKEDHRHDDSNYTR